jgi:hypothetical protein
MISKSDRLAKARASREANRASRAAQTIDVPPYQIVRVDEFNWQIRGPKLAVDGNIADALKALPVKRMLNDAAKDSLAVILGQQAVIIRQVEQAVEDARRMRLL